MHVVREATPDDRPGVQRLFAASIADADWLPLAARARVDFASVSSDETVHVVRDEAGDVVGFVSVYVPDSFVHHLFVAAHGRRSGVASALLTALRGRLPLPWRLKCVEANTGALCFYAAQGWREVGAGHGEDGPYRLLELAA